MDHQLLAKLFRNMLQIREFEKAAAKLYNQGEIRVCPPTYCGLEAIAVGVASVIEKRDYVICSSFSHAHYLALGGGPERGLAELMGKATGCCQGRGGPARFFDLSSNFFGAIHSSCSHLPAAAGIAFAQSYLRSNALTLCFITPEDVHHGSFHEALTLASYWELPILFIIENRQHRDSHGIDFNADLSLRALGYPLAREVVDGQDIFSVRASAYTATRRAREQKMPTLIEATVAALPEQGGAGSAESWEDPIKIVKEKLLVFEMQEEARKIEEQVQRDIDRAVRFALDSPFPDPKTALVQLYSLQGLSYA